MKFPPRLSIRAWHHILCDSGDNEFRTDFSTDAETECASFVVEPANSEI